MKLTVDIWSDFVCPFCYMGKRQLEKALAALEHKGEVDIIWHSFLLDPDAKNEPDKDIYTHLAELKGQSREWSVKMHDHVAQRAADLGLNYRFDIAKVVSTADAHRLLQFAKTKGRADVLEERFFKAHFTEGESLGDQATLVKLAAECGLANEDVMRVLEGRLFEAEVKADIKNARLLGVSGVPFFVINKMYGVSGAQDASVFIKVFHQALAEEK